MMEQANMKKFHFKLWMKQIWTTNSTSTIISSKLRKRRN